ncbi:MAG: 2,5-diamino-6-(ribosylamino)-4(3H)-pyrimidinone 5'-phosphate reductase [Thaumarchaeota archaeon]|nr:MAG: diaminohydroxyphosphoribosylaminopyrimidine reductase [Thaumarchaeota archaeon 13_1_40CM_3_38_6]TLY05385.1 MAG: 2,5-diamino-6-(ribosylamino)-4(3H)-pyrimidinone 5'-phosphate reductase [Nitrososphaerota archaeon]
MAKSRPHIILSAAVSIDGKIATYSGESNLSSKMDLIRLHRLRRDVDAILVGKNTINVDDPLLTVRHVKGKNPIRIILDSSGTISRNSKIVKTANKISTILVVTERATRITSKLDKKRVEIIRCGRNKINLKKLLNILQKRGISKILLEGGGITNWYFLKEKLVDELILTVTPYILGGKDAISLVQGDGFGKISKSPSFKLKKIKRMKNEIILYYAS